MSNPGLSIKMDSRQKEDTLFCFCLMLLILLALSIFEVNSVWAQIHYPATQYRGFNQSSRSEDVFAIFTPRQTDSAQQNGDNDNRQMSPDSWENTPGRMHNFDHVVDSPAAGSFAKPRVAVENLSRPLSTTDNDFQATPNLRIGKALTRGAAHPLNRSTNDEPFPESPSVPDDIRLPDALPMSVFPIQQESVLETNQTSPELRHRQIETSPNFQSRNGVYPLDDDVELQLDPSRLKGQNQNWAAQEHGAANSWNHCAHNDQSVAVRRANRPLPSPFDVAPPPPANSFNPYPRQDSSFSNKPPLLNQLGLPVVQPDFRPDLGHRAPFTTNREQDLNDYGQKFDHENKHAEYPPLSEIIATGRYFGSTSVLYLRPAFQANTAIFQDVSGVTETFDFSYKLANQFQLGFESKLGPGIELEYWGYSDFSRAASFTSNGIETATTSAWVQGANQLTRLTAANAGETLTARHRMELDVVGVSFFKEVKLPKARINGKFGFETAHIIHELTAELHDGGGSQIGSLRARSDVRGLGPQFELEYFRPVGHTKVEFMTAVGGSILFGKQSQVIENSTGADQSRLKADEFVMSFDYFAGAQYRQMWGENRYWFIRGGMIYQAWLHGGTAVLPQDNFGFRGFSLTAGVNR